MYKQLVEELKPNKIKNYSYSGREPLPKNYNKVFDIYPKDFLNFAKNHKSPDLGHRVNTLSNIKRAFFCQIDLLLLSFGLMTPFVELKDEEKDFIDKIKQLRTIGIVVPKKFSNIAEERNLLEHQYKEPEMDLTDCYELTQQFVWATNKFLALSKKKFQLSSENYFIDCWATFRTKMLTCHIKEQSSNKSFTINFETGDESHLRVCRKLVDEIEEQEG